MIVVTVFLLIMNEMEFRFVYNQKENCQYDHIPFNLEPNGIPFGSKLQGKLFPRSYPIKFERKWNTSFLSVMNL